LIPMKANCCRLKSLKSGDFLFYARQFTACMKRKKVGVVMERLTTEQIANMKEYFSRSKKVKTSSLAMKLSHDGLKLIDTIEAQQQEINLLIMEITELIESNQNKTEKCGMCGTKVKKLYPQTVGQVEFMICENCKSIMDM